MPRTLRQSVIQSQTLDDNKRGNSYFEAEKNKLPQMSHNFIIAIDHVYEDLIKLQTVIIQKGSYNNAKRSIIASWWQLYYCCGPILYRETSHHKLFWSEAAQQAGVLLCKIYFLWDPIIKSNGYQNVWEQQDLLRYHNRDIFFMFTGNGNKHYYLCRERGSVTHLWIACKSLSRWLAKMEFNKVRSHGAQQSIKLKGL